MDDQPRANDGKTLWAWMIESEEGPCQIISSTVTAEMLSDLFKTPNLGPGLVLTFRSRTIANLVRPIAEAHGAALGQRVFLREFRMVADHV